jgi:hypothetical protein
MDDFHNGTGRSPASPSPSTFVVMLGVEINCPKVVQNPNLFMPLNILDERSIDRVFLRLVFADPLRLKDQTVIKGDVGYHV